MRKIPHDKNPYKESIEMTVAWEQGYQTSHDEAITWAMGVNEWVATFRAEVRSALRPYWPSNPCVTDDEIIGIIKDLVAIRPRATKE